MKKYISKYVLVNRPDLEGKWWHRLAKVLIVGSTIAVLIILSVGFLSDFSLKTEDTRVWVSNEHGMTPFCPHTCTLEELKAYGTRPMRMNWTEIPQFFEVILGTGIWFLFWESVAYRSIVYVIYGKNKTGTGV